MKSLKDSYIYKFYDPVVHIGDQIKSLDTSGDFLKLEDIEENLTVIQKRFNYSLKNQVLNDLTNGNLKLMYNKDKFNLPYSMPCFLYQDSKGKVLSVINLNLYGVRRSRTDLFDVENRALYALMQTGYIFLYSFKNWSSINMNQTILKTGCSIYSKLFTKVLDKMFAVNLNPLKGDKIRFVAAKFFLMNIMEKSSSEIVDNMAYSVTTGQTAKTTLFAFSDEFKAESFTSFDLFIMELAERVDGLRNLTIREYINQFMKMYGSSTLFALDFFPFFCHMIFSSMVGAHFNSEYVIETVVGKEAEKFYNTLSSIVK